MTEHPAITPFLRRSLQLAIAGALITAGCSTAPNSPNSPGTPGFPAGGVADYQLGGPYAPAPGTKIVTRDSTATPAEGLYNICYVNAFQTQPGHREAWLRDRPDLVLSDRNGAPLIDENWPDELILDTSTATKRGRLADILRKVIATCAQKGFTAVEFDNLDSYTRSRGALTAANNLRLATVLAKSAHNAGLAVGQKNSAELGETGRQQAGFDFAVAEECLRFGECDRCTAVYGRSVIDIEYLDNLPAPLDSVCTQPNRAASTVIRDRALVPRGTDGYFYRAC
ncbi:endo alpha-1,4 polygalactosaminidase [Nocardia sp. NPDC059240]|uniref:endo alpha-1,4 polygalactosaminidase n=1 Tax=Nocardia sp. NPDC059240 TaxID=3346786 RepID=UPI00368A1DA9